MNDFTWHDHQHGTPTRDDAGWDRSPDLRALGASERDTEVELQRAVDFIVDECFFAVGQAVGTRKTLTYASVIWLRGHYRAKFLAAMRRFGNRWLQDRERVSAVALMMGERATRYAGDAEAIDVPSVRQAAEDVERYCSIHARRAARSDAVRDGRAADDQLPLLVGYWCSWEDSG